MHKPIFVLGPGRSFTTVVSAMLGQHPQLYSFPELNLTGADTVGQWFASTPGVIGLQRNGVMRTMAQLVLGSQTEAAVAEAENWLMNNLNMSTAELFAMLCAEVAPRRAIEKSPPNVGSEAHLERLRLMGPDAVYIHLTRHPIGTGNSIHAAEWYRPGREAYDMRGQRPVLDPQFYWLACHQRIVKFLKTVPHTRQIRVRGEDIMQDPSTELAKLCDWLGVSTDATALEAMMHPEASPFAKPGPQNAPYGNDPGFLESPALRPYKRPRAPLSGPVPWRGDGVGFTQETIEMARQFGYEDEQPEPKLPPGFDGQHGALISIEPDGQGMPMAHANLLDNSYSTLPALTTLGETRCYPKPAVGFANLGSYSGTDIAVTVFDSPEEPGLVAQDLTSGEKLWETPLSTLHTNGHQIRGTSGLLMVTLSFEDGTKTRCIYAGNPGEIVCIGYDGKVIWRRSTDQVGPPRCIRFTQDNALIYGASAGQDQQVRGQVVKLDPLTGDTIDICTATTRIELDGRKIAGEFKFYQSFVLHGDFAYLEGMFVPENPLPEHEDARIPASIMRFQVSGTPDGKIYRGSAAEGDTGDLPLAQIGTVGTRRQGGSPSAVIDKDGHPVIVANAFAGEHGTPAGQPVPDYRLRGFRDRDGKFETLWSHQISGQEDPTIVAAPAIDPLSETYVAATREYLYCIGPVSEKRGEIEPDMKVAALDLLAPNFKQDATRAELSSPITLCRATPEGNLIAYIGMAAWTSWEERGFSLMSALEIDVKRWNLRPLWTTSLAYDDQGTAVPAARSFAQPALFSYKKNGLTRSGLFMCTMSSGLAVVR